MSSTGSSSPGTPAPRPPRSGNFVQGTASAFELPFVMVACVVIGGALGVGADHLLHSAPAGMFLGGAAGLAAGVREILRRVSGGNRGKKNP